MRVFATLPRSRCDRQQGDTRTAFRHAITPHTRAACGEGQKSLKSSLPSVATIDAASSDLSSMPGTYGRTVAESGALYDRRSHVAPHTSTMPCASMLQPSAGVTSSGHAPSACRAAPSKAVAGRKPNTYPAVLSLNSGPSAASVGMREMPRAMYRHSAAAEMAGRKQKPLTHSASVCPVMRTAPRA